MARFTDRNGREWPLAIVFGDLPELKRRGLDLDAIDDLSFLHFRYPDRIGELVETLWWLARKDAGAQSREEFDAGLDGDAIERACDALVEAILDFRFRRLSAAAKKSRQTAESPAQSDVTRPAAASESRSGGGGPPGSSASTPGPSASGSSGG